MTRRTALPLLALVFALAMEGCGSKPPAGKRYSAEGNVQALDANVKTATIAFGQIGDWMGPMTMEYSIKPDREFEKLHVGDRIQATVVVVTDTSFYVTDIKVLPKQ